jgi:glycolate oxidase FAD binding subunit
MADPVHDGGRDLTAEIADRIRAAAADGGSILLRGGGTKLRRFGRHCDATPLDLAEHRGIIDYRPAEMVMTARAGTPIDTLRAAASAARQMLPFDAPSFGGRATLGGTLACNAAGSDRPWRGSVRDAVLGIRLVNGRGEVLRFGGDVIKNVAGYDVSRLQAGALGTLGCITEVSLRLLPLPDAVLALRRSCPREEAIDALRGVAIRPLPLTGAAWYADTLHLRLAGSESALAGLAENLSAYQEDDTGFWDALREWRLPELADETPLWILDVAPATALGPGSAEFLIDWGGARRFTRGADSARAAQALAARGGGHAQGLWGGDRDAAAVASPPPALLDLIRRTKAALDPQRIFNPGRLYPEF